MKAIQITLDDALLARLDRVSRGVLPYTLADGSVRQG
jgi:hypothetical protein